MQSVHLSLLINSHTAQSRNPKVATNLSDMIIHVLFYVLRRLARQVPDLSLRYILFRRQELEAVGVDWYRKFCLLQVRSIRCRYLDPGM